MLQQFLGQKEVDLGAFWTRLAWLILLITWRIVWIYKWKRWTIIQQWTYAVSTLLLLVGRLQRYLGIYLHQLPKILSTCFLACLLVFLCLGGGVGGSGRDWGLIFEGLFFPFFFFFGAGVASFISTSLCLW